MDKIERNHIRQLAADASPGPWGLCAHWSQDNCQCVGDHRGYIWHPNQDCVIAQMGCDTDEGGQMYPNVGQDGMRADARFIAAANPTVVMNLVDDLDLAERRLDAAKKALENLLESDGTNCEYSVKSGHEDDVHRDDCARCDAQRALAAIEIGCAHGLIDGATPAGWCVKCKPFATKDT